MVEKVYLTADRLLKDSYRLANQVIDAGFRPTHLVGIWRGGAPIGIAVQELLSYNGIECDHIAVRTSTGDADGVSSAPEALHTAPGDGKPATALVCGAARDSLKLLARVAELREEKTTGGAYPRTDLGRALSQVASGSTAFLLVMRCGMEQFFTSRKE